MKTKTIPWHGKLSHVENKCPHCEAKKGTPLSVKIFVRDLSAQHYKKCLHCGGEFVDTYLVDFDDNTDAWYAWDKAPYLDSNIDQVDLFFSLKDKGYLIYDEENINSDEDYYDIPPQSVHFILEDL